VKLLGGRVLIAGGSADTGSVTASAELFDPTTGVWTATGSMNVARSDVSGTLLPDGRVLVAGGQNGSSSLSSAEIYDPASGAWSVTGFMGTLSPSPSYLLSSIPLLLTNGKVLVWHGSFGGELFDPISGQFQPAPGMAIPSSNPIASTLLADGRVLLVSSLFPGSNPNYDNEIYDPTTTTLSKAPTMDVPPPASQSFGMWSRLLPDGRVLLRFFDHGVGLGGCCDFDSAYVYNVQTNTAVPSSGNTKGADVLLASGLVLITGGSNTTGNYESPVLYDPVVGQVLPVQDMPRHLASEEAAIVLDDGRALVVGIDRTGQPAIDAFAEVYSPAFYSNPAPVISSVSSLASNPSVIAVDIRGAGFLPNSSVSVGNTKLMTIYLGSQRLVSFVPAQLGSSLNSPGLTVTNPVPTGGSAGPVPAGFALPPPVISSMTPDAAAVGTQFTAVVSGQNLVNLTSVSFSSAGVTATVLQTGSASNTVVLSVAVAGNATPGASSLTIVTGTGTATLQNALAIQSAAVPTTTPLPIPEVETGAIRSGYAIVTPDAGSAAPLATLTFGIVSGGIVQSQAAILPVSLTSDSSVQVDVLRAIGRNLGLAIANGSGTAATITLTLRDDDGTMVGSPASIPVPAAQQIARFVTELFPSTTIGPAFRGSVDVQSSVPVSLTGLRFSGIEFSTVPIVASGVAGIPQRTLASGQVGGPTAVMFPQFAMSGGWATAFSLVNTTSNTISGRIDIFDTSGNPMTVKLNGTTQSTYAYSISAKGTFRLAPLDSNGQSPF